MTKKRRRPIHLHVMVSEEEQALIQERMAEAGIRNMGAYMRKMALSGYVLHVDLSPVRELVSLQRRCSNNLNQVAIQANTYGAIYPEELAALQRDYTYDSVTNNYYYITYEAPTPSPSPDPTPTPDPGTDPTPTPKPDGSGDVSTPESGKPGSSSGGQSWWEKLLGKIGDAIVDGLLGAISAVLKLIFKLFTTILGWIIWLVSQVLTLFPFLPPGLGALLIGGVVVCFIIGLIKFIRG